MLDQILADIRKTFDVDFVPLQLDDGQLEVLNINNMQSHLDGLLARHAIHDPLKDLPLWAKVWPGSFVLGRFLRKLEPEGKTMLELGGKAVFCTDMARAKPHFAKLAAKTFQVQEGHIGVKSQDADGKEQRRIYVLHILERKQ